MKNLFIITIASLVLTGCMYKNYEKAPHNHDHKAKTTIHWSDGEKTDIKPMTIETKK